MGKSSLPKVHRYSMQFKATAVRLSELPDVLIQDVAEALDIHPFMLSRWRKQAWLNRLRIGRIRLSMAGLQKAFIPRIGRGERGGVRM